MLYIVGDSNSVFTSKHLVGKVELNNEAFCNKGLTTEEVVQKVHNSKKDTGNASAFFLFVGMNDDLTGEAIAAGIMALVSMICKRIKNKNIPLIISPPFCVNPETKANCNHDNTKTNKNKCDSRLKAAQELTMKLKEVTDYKIHVITSHVDKDFNVRPKYITNKMDSINCDPLHLNEKGYAEIASRVEEIVKKSARGAPLRRSPRLSRRR